jgi:hypothetical protein
MVVLITACNHLRAHIAAQTQLDANILLLNPLAKLLLDVDHVAQAIWLPAQQRGQFCIRAGELSLGKMQCHLQPRSFRTSEGSCKDSDVAFGWIAAQIDAYDTVIFEREINDFLCFSGRVAPVDGENEVRAKCVDWVGIVPFQDLQYGADIVVFGQVRRRNRPRGGTKLQVDDAIGLEVLQDGCGGALDAREVVDQGVDVG